jgi:hypothetical protein
MGLPSMALTVIAFTSAFLEKIILVSSPEMAYEVHHKIAKYQETGYESIIGATQARPE